MGFATNYTFDASSYKINNDEIRPFNEGWRFAIAYGALALFCAAHAAYFKYFATGQKAAPEGKDATPVAISTAA